MILRIIVAIVVMIAIRLLLGDVFALIGFPLEARAERVLMILLGLAAVLYIIRGAPIPPFWRQP